MRRGILGHRRLLVASLALVAVLLAGWHYYTLYVSLTGAREDLLAAQARLSAVGLDVGAADLAVARERLHSASANVDRARSHMRWDPLLHLAGVLPRLDDQVAAAHDLVDIAGLLVQVGQNATLAGDKAVALRDRPPTGEPLTQSLVALLDDTREDLERMDALTRELVDRRLRMGDANLLPPLSRARERLDKELPRVANFIEEAKQSQQLLPRFLGFEGDRHYLVLALNSGELLPGGGLVTASGILPVSRGVNGHLDFTDSTSWKQDAEALGIPYIEPPAPLKRYLLRDYTWNLLVSNWSPDFPTWSQQALEFYQLVHGREPVDGVIAVDLVVLERLLAVTGPKTLEVAGHGAVTFDRGNAVLLLESLTRQPFEPTDDRKSVVGDLAQKVIEDLLKLPSSEWAHAVEVVRQLGEERHIQVLSFDPREQTIIRDVRWDGRMEQSAGDYLQFNEASLLSTKLNLLIQPEGTLTVDVNDLGDAHHELRLRYTNSLPEWSRGKDPELVRQLMLGGLYGGYLRVFGPRALRNEQVEMDGKPAGIESTGLELQSQWFSAFLTLPPGASREVAFRWDVALADTNPQDGYDLYIQKQPGTAGLCLALDVSRNGRAAIQVTVSGGERDAHGRLCLTTDARVHARFD
jgi:hypothetical protein